MQIEDKLYTDICEYLSRRPWVEVNTLIAQLARAKLAVVTPPDVAAVSPNTRKPKKEGTNG